MNMSRPTSRREMLLASGMGFGALALAGLMQEHAVGDPLPKAPAGGDRAPHFAPRAKSVICLFMGGGPSQVDTFDPKPELTRLAGQDVPESIAASVPRIARAPLKNLLPSPYRFQKRGASGLEISELYPELGALADDLCIVRSMKHHTPIHAPAEYLAMSGTGIGDRPSLGAWITYGLGSENQNLPAFVLMVSNGETARAPAYHAGFLPANYQATRVTERGPNDLAFPAGVGAARREKQLQLLEALQREHLEQNGGDPELEARIRSYELAFRMQAAAPEAFDLNAESTETKALYGLDQEETREFGSHCLLARRLVERGVRFVQLRHGKWDAHSKLAENHTGNCRRTDRPIAALLTDLKRRGLFEETLLLWGGEFGRTPAAQGTGANAGRDHSPSGYSIWLAGAGVRGGQSIGATDPVGYAAIERPIHPSQIHATILSLLGIDQRRLWYLHNGRKELATVNGAEVVREILS